MRVSMSWWRLRLANWLSVVAERVRPWPTFKPAVFYNEDLRLTEIVLEDTTIVWCPWRVTASMGHAVDLGYDGQTGELVGVKIWDDVRQRVNAAVPT